MLAGSPMDGLALLLCGQHVDVEQRLQWGGCRGLHTDRTPCRLQSEGGMAGPIGQAQASVQGHCVIGSGQLRRQGDYACRGEHRRSIVACTGVDVEDVHLRRARILVDDNHHDEERSHDHSCEAPCGGTGEDRTSTRAASRSGQLGQGRIIHGHIAGWRRTSAHEGGEHDSDMPRELRCSQLQRRKRWGSVSGGSGPQTFAPLPCECMRAPLPCTRWCAAPKK